MVSPQVSRNSSAGTMNLRDVANVSLASPVVNPAGGGKAARRVSTASASASQFDRGAADALAPLGQDGTSDERPLDDQPGQSQAEGAMDSPALMMARPDAKAPLVTMSRPRPYAAAAWRTAYLDGPQRPPCRVLVSA